MTNTSKWFACLKLPFVVIICFLPLMKAVAQPDYKYKFTARLVSADSAKAIVNSHIVNKTRRTGTVSDQSGSFTITANRKDTLEISSIGYKTLVIAVHDSMFNNRRIIALQPTVYQLGDVNIQPYLNYDRFKRDVMNTKVEGYDIGMDPISRFEITPKPLPNQGFNVGLGSPVTYLYNMLSKSGKQYRYYLGLVNRTADHIVIGDKFNGDLVSQLTGLKDDELVAFMSSCLFTKEYLLLATSEEINRAIMRKYREYVQKQDNNITP